MSDLEARMYVADSRYPAAVKQVRKLKLYWRVVWGFIAIDYLIAMSVLAFPVVSDAPQPKWLIVASFVLIGVSLIPLGFLFAANRVVNVYVKSGRVVYATSAVIDAYKKLLRETNTHWSLDRLFDRQRRHNLLDKEMDGDYKEEAGTAQEKGRTNS